MKSRDSLIRLKKFQVEEKRRRIAQIEMMIAEFERMASDLDREIRMEEERAGITDPTHYAYPTYARAAFQRRENLVRSADELRAQVDDARHEHEEELDELKKFEMLDDREQSRDRSEPDAVAARA